MSDTNLEIANTSYTNKDFGQIYPELVDLVKTLTNKWNPAKTNESDPGTVLLKCLAFLGDKLNYNIDKNILEQYIQSATQETSVRRLCDMLGYNVGYYNSCIATIGFKYTGKFNVSDATDVSASSSFTIKKYDTTLETDEGVIYTLLDDIQIYEGHVRVPESNETIRVIQGELKHLSVIANNDTGDNSLITLQNLDSNNRVYFPDVEVAENGIFIDKSRAADSWTKVDNLNDVELGKKYYKFGYDSDKGFPYIQFPEDIADLIESGVSIDYIVSEGTLGKLLTNKLTAFKNIKIVDANANEYTTLSEDVYTLTNSLGTGAKDPETIDEIYNNFSKTVGTFETLVSCNDYTNYLNTYTDDSGDKLISNGVVLDLRTDPTLSRKINTRISGAQSVYKTVIKESTESTVDNSLYYSLVLHANKYLKNSISNESTYKNSYTRVTDTQIQTIEETLEDIKCINKFFTKPADNKIDMIKAGYTLDLTVFSNDSLSDSNKLAIKNNIKTALYQNFNSNNVTMGKALTIDELTAVVKGADSRINYVSIQNPEISYKIRTGNNDTDYTEESDDFKKYQKEILLDNILAGRIPVLENKNVIQLNYDQKLDTYGIKDKLAAITGEVKITPSSENPYTLKKNESIQLVGDNFVTFTTYPAYVYYCFRKTDGTVGDVGMQKDVVHKLTTNETLYIQYTDSEGVEQYITYNANSETSEGKEIYFKPNFDVLIAGNSNYPAGKNKSPSASKWVNFKDKKVLEDYSKDTELQDGDVQLFALDTNDTIELQTLNTVTLDKNAECFWYVKPRLINSKISNEKNNLLFNSYTETENGVTYYYYILEEGEMLIYPNDDFTSLNVLGSGTKLRYTEKELDRTSSDAIDLKLLESSTEELNIDTFENSFKWETLPKALEIIETSISSWTEKDIINKVIFKNSSDTAVDSSWKQITSLTVNDSSIQYNIKHPVIRSVLSINGSINEPQQVLSGQIVNYYTADVEKEDDTVATLKSNTITENNYIQLYPIIDTYSNLGILASIIYKENSETYEPEKIDADNYKHQFTDYTLYTYSIVSDSSSSESTTSKTISGLFKYYKTQKNKYPSINSRGEYMLEHDIVKGYFDTSSDYSIQLDLNSSYGTAGCKINFFDTYTLKTYLKCISGTDTTTIDLTDFITNGQTEDILYISKPVFYTIYKSLLDDSDTDTTFISAIDTETDNTFDYLGTLDSSTIITSADPKKSFLDANNVYNKLTIPYINVKDSKITVLSGK